MTSKLTEEVLASSGPMRAAFEAKLRVEAEKLTQAEQQLAAAQRDRAVLEGLVTSALADFAPVWNALTTTNRGRLLRALVDRVVVDEASGKVELHLIDLTGTGATDAREAA